MKFLQILILLVPFLLFSQESNFYNYGLDQGLSQETVQCFIKDSDGFLWIGTQDGLNRFDGNSFETFFHDSENKYSISGNDIIHLLDNNETIWVNTKNKGICYYDKKTDVFYTLDNDYKFCTGLTKKDANTIYATFLKDGILKIIKKDKEVIIDKIKIPILQNKRLTSISKINQKYFYVGTKSGELYRLNSENISNVKKINFKNINVITTFLNLKDKLWIGTENGLYLFDKQSNKVNYIRVFETIKSPSINEIIVQNNTFYIATDDGLVIASDFNEETKKFKAIKSYKGDTNNLNSITSNRVYSVLFDENKLWIGTNKLDVLSLEEPVFKNYTTKTKTALNNNHIFSIFKIKNYLFVGTRKGLNCIDNFGNTTVITKENTNNQLAYNVIRGICKDNKNNLWLATTKGVSILNLEKFNPKKPIITTIYNNPNDKNSLSHNKTRSVYLDKNNQIWICTYGGGINRFTGDLAKGIFTFERFTHQDLDKNSISSDYTFDILQDFDYNYWIATENGLNKLTFDNNYNNAKFTTYRSSLSKNSLHTNGVLTSFLDSDNELWIGTDDGLYLFHPKTNDFTYFGKKEGLSNTVIYNILEDTDKKLWLATNAGLFQFNKKDASFVNFSKKDGLKSTEFNLGAKYNDKNILYFGGTKGVDYFNPNKIKELYKEGNLNFTILKVKGKKINPIIDKNILQESITKSNQINLKHNQFPVIISFTDFDFNLIKNNDFLYKLIPNDEEWNSLGDKKEINLLNLSAGNYTIQVQGKTKNSIWHKKPLEIQLTVSPPWYYSKLAILFYTLLILGSVYFLYRFQLQRKLELQEVEQLREINDLKTKLYTNITHEFRTPITVILGMAESIKERIKQTKIDIANPIEMIERNSKSLLSLVNQILDLSKLEKGKLSLNLEQSNIIIHLKYLTESFHSYAKEKNIDLIFYNEIDEVIMDFDRNKITQILSNLISNAIKFCNENDKVIVHVKQKTKKGQAYLVIKVKDSGIGISPENLPFIFDRFYQAENNENNKHDGTGIGLALTKELVKLMKGEIQVESKLNKGTKLTILLPIKNETTIKSQETLQEQNSIAKKIKSIAEFNLDIDLPICLIVEDNNDVATYIKMCLSEKYQILYANNGMLGVELALKYIPDIIISDIMMPKKNGFELCQEIKEDIKTNHIPVILLTAKTAEDDKLSGLKLGADAYLTKPFNKEELLIRMERLIAIRKTLQLKYKDISSLNISQEEIPKTEKNLANQESVEIIDSFIVNIIKIINENIEDENFNATALSDKLFISESQLYRKLKALTNTSTAIFIRKIRLKKAKELLETTKLSSSEICYKTGFSNPSWFSKAFKKEFGHSPNKKRYNSD